MNRLAACLAAAMLLLGASAPGQEEHAGEPDVMLEGAAPTAAEAVDDDRLYFALLGGGELIGRLVKEAPERLYIDIGPRIIEVPIDSIVSREPLTRAAGRTEKLATGTGVFDPSTGSLIFRGQRDTGELLSQTEIVARAKRSVVLVSNPRGAGSGFVIDREGHIITNQHVVHGEKYQKVNLFRQSGNQWERVTFDNVPVRAYSSLFDIALLKLDLEAVREKGVDLTPLPLAADGSLQVGDNVYAIGNPGVGGGRLLEHTVSEGIVSSLSRNVGDVLYVQTTAAVNPGNSGGPLINARGEVVGLVTLKAFMQEGIGFALPADLIRRFIEHSESYEFSEQARNRGFRYLPPE